MLASNVSLAQQISIQVYVNQTVPVTDLTPAQLRRIFTMRQTQWPNGEPIKVVVFKSQDPLHQQFAKNVLQLFPYQLERIWNRLIYSGQGERPVEVDSSVQMQRFISTHPGAIGYMPVTDTINDAHLIHVREDK
ncbi:substrate-binding domain-containing protein [Neptunicella marina]|nr:substrate-binding domain-containing protein [Neptunicella marina]